MTNTAEIMEMRNRLYLAAESIVEKHGLPRNLSVIRQVYLAMLKMENDLANGVNPEECERKLREALFPDPEVCICQ